MRLQTPPPHHSPLALLPNAQEELYQFFAGLMAGVGIATAPGAPLVSCKITPDKARRAARGVLGAIPRCRRGVRQTLT